MSFSSNLNHYGMVHAASVSDVLLDTSFTPPCQRMGAMVAFRSFQEFTRCVRHRFPSDPFIGEEVINGVCGFAFFFRNITDVLSCFTDSPPPSPTFPDGGNPVLYGEEDNKVIWNGSLKATAPLTRRPAQPSLLMCFVCGLPEHPGWAYPYLERCY